MYMYQRPHASAHSSFNGLAGRSLRSERSAALSSLNGEDLHVEHQRRVGRDLPRWEARSPVYTQRTQRQHHTERKGW